MTERSPVDLRADPKPTRERPPDVERFSAGIEAAKAWVTSLRFGWSDTQQTDRPLAFDPVYVELRAALEKLRVAEEELRLQNEELAVSRELIEVERHRYEELFELAPDPYIITDENGIIRECNLAASSLLAAERPLLLSRPLASFIDAEARLEFRRHLDALKGGDATVHWRSGLRKRDGTTMPIAVSAAPIRHGRRVSGLRWMIHDDSEYRAAHDWLLQLSEELAAGAGLQPTDDVATRGAEEVSARKRPRSADRPVYSYVDLLGMVSHEIRTPLAAAHGYIELLRQGLRGELTAIQNNDIDSIAACHEHLLRVLDNALAVARLDSGHLELSLSQVPVDAALRGLPTYVQPDFQAKRVSYTYSGGDPQTLVLADRAKLHQIMLNLLTNAVKFTRPGGSVTVSWHATEHVVAVAVGDTGIGIAPEDLDRVFEPYVRVAREGREDGSGLGLAISRKLARAMGGDVTVSSIANVGSTFLVTLPRVARTGPRSPHAHTSDG